MFHLQPLKTKQHAQVFCFVFKLKRPNSANNLIVGDNKEGERNLEVVKFAAEQ